MRSVPRITPAEAARLVPSGATIVVGGFGMTGYPVHLLHALAETTTDQLTYIGNNVGEPGLGGGRLIRNGQIARAIGSYFTTNPDVVRAWQQGQLQCDVLPQGTLSEAIRAAGAGLGGFYTPTAAGTTLAENSETRVIDGVEMVFVKPLPADIALVRAWRADTAGNLQYRMTENNFNQAAATAARLVIAEVQQIVPVGDIDPDHVDTPGCYVDYLVEAEIGPAELGTSAAVGLGRRKADSARLSIARAVLDELQPGSVVNLGVGIPTLVADLITEQHNLTLHTENGMLGVGPAPQTGGAMEHPVNASKVPVTAMPGSSYFDSAESFALIRGGHLDVAVLGGMQVDQQGNLANWALPGKPLLGVGGAMDLASGARRVIVAMTHCSDDGTSKLVRQCTLPLTASGVVDTLVTNLAVFRFDGGDLKLHRLMPGVELDELRVKTAAEFRVD